MKAYKFLADDGRGVFSRFAWPLPDGGPGPWVESEVMPCRSGVHACRPADLPYWVAPALYEIELDGPVEHELKVVAPRGRLIRRIDDWNEETRQAYSQMCIARARELAAGVTEPIDEWAPAPEMAEAAGPALMSFMAARIAERLGGLDAYVDERRRQSAWLVKRLGIGSRA
jgi:hypothetical protein